MATRLPPPKRIKLNNGAPIKAPEAPQKAPAPNVVVQFVSEDDGVPLAPAVNIPADFGRDGLEAMINKLASKDDEPTPYAFHVNAPSPEDPTATTRILISNSLQSDVLEKSTNTYTSEDIITVYCSPQAVFRVRPATRCSSTLSGHASAILCAAFSPTGNLLATGSGDNNARLWNLDTETPSHTLSGHKGWVLCVEWEPTERKLATGGHDGQVRLWDPKSGKAIGDALKGHSKWVTSLSWEPAHINPDDPRLASSSKDGTVRVWNTGTRRLEYTLGSHTASVNVVRWGGGSGKGALYTASSDRTIKIWDPNGGKLLHTLKDHAHWVTTLALNTDFVLRTGPYDHTGQRSSSDDEG
ncbi:hypothetical protein FRC07_001278 [Ceratobasidium sp. 392]|nr:hypothetical protein FRC07_001278 [Ceratobasidium sp. 392]